jgi:hypothetical protein
MLRKLFLVVTAASEGATGIALLAAPAVVLKLLLGASQPAAPTLATAQIAGAALVTLGISCWLARKDCLAPSQTGLLCGMLFYDSAAALLLALAGVRWQLVGIALWPAVALHSALGVWCLACLAVHSRPSTATTL